MTSPTVGVGIISFDIQSAPDNGSLIVSDKGGVCIVKEFRLPARVILRVIVKHQLMWISVPMLSYKQVYLWDRRKLIELNSL